MLVDFKTRKIKCFECNKWLGFSKLFLHVLYEGSISCEENHLVGNESDMEWQKLCGLN